MPAPAEGMLSSIQVLRALAAWSVVFHHYCLIFTVAEPPWWRRGFLAHGSVGVDVFFVVSGFVMALGASAPGITPRTFMAKRLGRIIPAYWLFTLVVALVIVSAPEVMPNQGVTPASLAQSLLFIPAMNPSGLGVLPVNTVGWTLNLEMMFYLIVGASLFAKLPQRWLWIIGIIVVVQQLLAPLAGGTALFYATPLLYEFVMGIAVFHLWKAGALRGPAWMFGVLAVIAIAILLRSDTNSGMRAFECGLGAFLLVCSFIGLEKLWRRARFLARLGDHSYSVYLIHPTILYVGYYVFRSTRIRHGLTSLGCFLAIGLIGWASYRFVERPVGRWLTGLLRART